MGEVIKVETSIKPKAKDVKAWLTDTNFYIHGLVYMTVRIAVNVTMTVQPFYLNQVTGFEETVDRPTPVQLAVVPLLSYISSLIFSLFFQ
jgi:Na+/melibiose symporter-like transporter